MCIVPSLEVVRILKKGSPALVFVSLSFMKIWTYSYYLPPAHEAETPSPVLHSAEHGVCSNITSHVDGLTLRYRLASLKARVLCEGRRSRLQKDLEFLRVQRGNCVLSVSPTPNQRDSLCASHTPHCAWLPIAPSRRLHRSSSRFQPLRSWRRWRESVQSVISFVHFFPLLKCRADRADDRRSTGESSTWLARRQVLMFSKGNLRPQISPTDDPIPSPHTHKLRLREYQPRVWRGDAQRYLGRRRGGQAPSSGLEWG